MTSNLALRWVLSVFCCLSVGYLAGLWLDGLREWWSTPGDYPAGFAARRGILWGLYAGSSLSVIDDLIQARKLSWQRWWLSWRGVCAGVIIMLLWGLGRGMLWRSLTETYSGIPTATARHAAAIGLGEGAIAGAMFSVIIISLDRWNMVRRLNQTAATEAPSENTAYSGT